MSYDARCEDLARIFLDDSKEEISKAGLDVEKLAAELAQEIQDAIEDFLIHKKL